MIKIFFPLSYDLVKPFFNKPEHRNDLYMVAEDEEILLAVVRFAIKKDTLDIYDITVINNNTSIQVLDGLIRNVLYHGMEIYNLDKCKIYNVPQSMETYFLEHNFKVVQNCLYHEDYVQEFFKVCPGCKNDN